MKPKVSKTFAIRHKETGEYFVSGGGKNAWRSIAAAKNAFAYHGASKSFRDDEEVKMACSLQYKVEPVELEHPYRMRSLRLPYFHEQDVWEIVELSAKVEDCGKRLKQAESFLKEIVSTYKINDDMMQRIEKFLFEEK